MTRQLNINDEDFKVLSKWASVSRTLNNCLGLLEDYQIGKPLDEGRIQIALDELPDLIKCFDNINTEAKKILFMENNKCSK